MDVKGLKFDLCCAARLLYRFGLSVGNAGHLSITIGNDRMLVNRFGPSFRHHDARRCIDDGFQRQCSGA